MIIRAASDQDWLRIWPFFSRIVAAGETYAHPDALTRETAEQIWMEKSPGRTVVAVPGSLVAGARERLAVDLSIVDRNGEEGDPAPWRER